MRVKVLSIFLLLVLIVSMTGCGTPDNDEIDDSLTPQEEEEYEDHEEIEGLINEDEDEVLLDLEEILINNGWIKQDIRSRLLMVTDKLREFIEE